LRAWVPACSSGEEAYTLAMVFREALDQTRPQNHYALQIFATDLDSDAIDKARIGLYPGSVATDIPSKLLGRYFTKEDDKYRINQEIREMVIFAPKNLVMDPPFTKLDMLTCRNSLIYLEADLQKKLLPLFHYSLLPNGVLVLGSAETVGNATELFTPCTAKTRIYHRRERLLRHDLVELPAAYVNKHMHLPSTGKSFSKTPDATNLQEFTNAFLLKQFTPAAVLATDKGDILYIHGKTGSYLEPAAGKVNNNLFAMAREGLSAPLNERLRPRRSPE
jgi:two-component system CheB/CheR fusion protein